MGMNEDRVRGGRLVAEGLKAAGVRTAFALAGGHIMPTLDACVPLGVGIVDTRHEGAAALAAEGWALATGEPGCAIVTAGPGFTNSLTGLFDAGAGCVPLVLLGGRSGLRMAGQGAVGELDQRAVATPGVKWAATCLEAARIPRYVEEAFYRARAGRPGAVYLEVPADLQVAELHGGGRPLEGFLNPPPRPTAPAADIERAADVLRTAERPLIIAGGGAFWSGAGEALTAFCELTRIPVTTTSSARGLVPDSHPCCLGSLVHGGTALLAADAVLVLGSAFNANLGYGRPPLFSPDQRIVQVDILADGLGGNRRPDLGLAGDVTQVLRDLAAAWGDAPPGSGREGWLSDTREWASGSLETWDAQLTRATGGGLHTGIVARDVAAFARQATGGACTLVGDGGDALAWTLGYFFAEGSGRALSTTTALGTLGVGLPFALAARAARPAEPVFAMVGDGAFGLAAMEVDTMVRHELPAVIVVSNNHGWGDVRHEVQELREYAGPRVAAELASSRYDRLAQALGAHGEHVTAIEQLRPALDRACASGLPAVVNVETDAAVEADLLKIVAEMSLM